MEECMIQRLYDEAVNQREIAFTAPGFMCTLRHGGMHSAQSSTVCRAGARPYDMSDAVDYLNRLIGERGGQAVRQSELRTWAGEFKFDVPSDDLMSRLGNEYTRQHGGAGTGWVLSFNVFLCRARHS
ncbi:hypothetical protein F5887DRAFT_990895 [Amanita rubescens]|nr:hypothetical protein F5887DRAFT_990895 [Amanita rubescens]